MNNFTNNYNLELKRLASQPAPNIRFRSFHVGDEISFPDMIPGELYFRRWVLPYYNDNNPADYEEIKLLSKETDNQGNLTGRYRYSIPNAIEFYENAKRQPMTPEFPNTLPSDALFPEGYSWSDNYDPDRQVFYKVSPFKRAKHLVATPIKEKLKKNILRKHVNTILNRAGFSTNLGTGPANIIRKYLNLQPPKGTRRIFPPIRQQPTQQTIVGGGIYGKSNKRKTRKTRRRT